MLFACFMAAVADVALCLASSGIVEGRDMRIGRARLTRDFAWPMALIGVILVGGGALGLFGLLCAYIWRAL